MLRPTLEFFLFDWLRVEEIRDVPRYADHSRETFDAVLDTAERVAREKFAPANRLVDVTEPAFDGERVLMPAATAEAVRAYAEAGLIAAGHDYEQGGMQLPYVVDMAANSFFHMASIGLSAYGMLTSANANLLMVHGSAAQQRAFALPELVGAALGTMCLSEPQAGSSLGDIVTRAVPDGVGHEEDPLGPRYRISGNKMWISGGEHDLSDNIVHLVLAKIVDPEGGLPPGVGGISLFVVPRTLVDAEGRPVGPRNDIALAGLNHKLGYRGTVNTLLNFGEGKRPVASAPGEEPRAGAIGYRIGAPGKGLAYMFHMMNEARINVGLGATMLGYAGYAASLGYARERPQGRHRTAVGKDAAQPQVPIIEHADVKRMLLAQKAYAEGALALGLYCGNLVDAASQGGDAAQVHRALTLLGILTPVAKSWPSEWCLEANNLAIQILGGYGYTRDFPVEQYWRDNRLNMIHEGTHGIQALDLLGRKVVMDDAEALILWRQTIDASCIDAKETTELAGYAPTLQEAADRVVQATREAWSGNDLQATLANATPYLQAFGHVTCAWIWLDVAQVAVRDLAAAEAQHAELLRGKIQAMRYFFRYELPKIGAWLDVVAACDPTALDMQEGWF